MITTAEIRGLVARADARREAVQAAARERRGKFSPAGPVTTPDALVRRMADTMREIEAVQGSVGQEDLRLRGYTDEAIAKYGEAATKMARKAAVRSAA